jgi:hypothetical protein
VKLPRLPRPTRSEEHPYGRFSWDRWAPFKWSATVFGLFILDGLWGIVIGLVLGIELVLGGSARRLLALAIPCFASVLLWNLWRGLPTDDSLSALWVLDNTAANQLAFAGFTFLVSGLLISPHPQEDEHAGPGSDHDHAPAPGGSHSEPPA